jgi:hypothetical protein
MSGTSTGLLLGSDFDEYVQILRQSRFTVTRHRVTADEQKPYVMRE